MIAVAVEYRDGIHPSHSLFHPLDSLLTHMLTLPMHMSGRARLSNSSLVRFAQTTERGQACAMAGSMRATALLLCCIFIACYAQDQFEKPPLPADVSLEGLYENITAVAAIAANLKPCAPDDAICIALKALLTPPPPAGPALAPGPSQRPCRAPLYLLTAVLKLNMKALMLS